MAASADAVEPITPVTRSLLMMVVEFTRRHTTSKPVKGATRESSSPGTVQVTWDTHTGGIGHAHRRDGTRTQEGWDTHTGGMGRGEGGGALSAEAKGGKGCGNEEGKRVQQDDDGCCWDS